VSDEAELIAAPGFVDDNLQAEFPGLRLSWVSVEGRLRPSPRSVRQRLHAMSNRYHGAGVVAMRTQPIPHAYRAFFRQIGLDPDVIRIPSEEIAVTRLLDGGLRIQGLPDDALRIAVIETGVPVWALDADRVDVGGLGIRLSAAGEPFGADGHPLAPGRLVVADARSVHALLFGPIARGQEVSRQTSRLVLFAVGVDGVPDIHLEEALWVCADVLKTLPGG
jgi:DNA/RNA-binding domain of Phe-tRNA-synthetase-like protein